MEDCWRRRWQTDYRSTKVSHFLNEDHYNIKLIFLTLTSFTVFCKFNSAVEIDIYYIISLIWKQMFISVDYIFFVSFLRFEGGKPEVVFTQNDQVAEKDASKSTPKNHKFVLTGIASQSLNILSQTHGTG